MNKILIILILFFRFEMATQAQESETILYINFNNDNVYKTKKLPDNDEYKTLEIIAKNSKPPKKLKIIPESKPDPNSPFNAYQLCNELKKAGSVSNVVISGHDGGGIFGGSVGQMSSQDFADVIKMDGIKDKFKNTTGIYLLGCYSNTVSQALKWNEAFPQAKLIAGFDQKSPLNGDKRVSNYLNELILKTETKLKSEADQGVIIKLLENASSNLPGAFVVNACKYYSKDKEHGKNTEKPKLNAKNLDFSSCTIDSAKKVEKSLDGIKNARFCGLSQKMKMDFSPSSGQQPNQEYQPTKSANSTNTCDQFKMHTSSLKKQALKYTANDKKCDIEPDLPGKPSPLRLAYETMRNYEHCIEAFQGIPDEQAKNDFAKLSEDYESPDSTIYLVKNDHVFQNYFAAFEKDLKDTKAILDKNMSANDLYFLDRFIKNKGNISRGEWNSGMSLVNKKLDEVAKENRKMFDDPDLKKIEMQNEFSSRTVVTSEEQMKNITKKIEEKEKKEQEIILERFGQRGLDNIKLMQTLQNLSISSEVYLFNPTNSCMGMNWLDETKNFKNQISTSVPCQFSGKPKRH